MVVNKNGKNFVTGDYTHISSEQYLKQRSGLPEITPNMAKAVSAQRREMLEQEMEDGHFKSYAKEDNKNTSTKLGLVTYSSTKKTAASGNTGVGMTGNYRGQGGSLVQNPNFYHPLLSNSKMNLPRDKAAINAWSRIYVETNGVVQNAVTLHSTYPISKLNIKSNPQDENFWNEQIEELDLLNVCIAIALEYWITGEVFPYAELDESQCKWSRIKLQNPDYIDVHPSVGQEPILSLRPDENLKRVCTSNKSLDIQQRQLLDPMIVKYVQKGQNIPLDNYHVSAIQRKLNPNALRGLGLVNGNFSNLMLLDRLRESKFYQADNLINPLTLVKVGSNDGLKPTYSDLEGYRDIFQNAQNDPDFKIFTHNDVTIERIGANGGIIDTMADITQLWKEIFSGLMVPSVLMDGGGDVTYANGGVTLDVLRQRYMSFRNMLTIWLRRKIFAPIAKMRDMYEIKNGKEVLRVPDVEWNHMSLFDMTDYINILKELAVPSDGKVESRKLSIQTLYRSLGLNFEDEKAKMRQEFIADAIATKERKELAHMSLTDLRALGPTSEIQESPYRKTPGEVDEGEEEEGLPGIEPEGEAAPA